MAQYNNYDEDEKLLNGNVSPEEEDKPDYASILAQYDKIRSEGDEATAKAQKMANFKNTVLNVGDGLSSALGGYGEAVSGGKIKADDNSAFFQDGIKQNNDKVAGVKAAGTSRLNDILKKDEIGREQVERGQKDATYNALNDASSPRSQLTQNMARAKLREQARVADEAGDKEGANRLREMESTLGDKSAADIGNMGLLDGSGYNALLNNKKADARAAQANTAEDRRNSAMKFNREETLRKQVDGNPVIKEAVKGKIGIDKAVSMIDRKSGIADEALLMMWNKGMDPLSVVRETEFARSTQGLGIVATLEMKVKQAMGEGRLTPEAREEILASMRALQAGNAPYIASKLSTIDSAIREYGLTPENVYGSFTAELATDPNSKTTTPAPSGATPATTSAPVTIPPPSGTVKIKAPNGQIMEVKKESAQKYIDKGGVIVP